MEAKPRVKFTELSHLKFDGNSIVYRSTVSENNALTRLHEHRTNEVIGNRKSIVHESFINCDFYQISEESNQSDC